MADITDVLAQLAALADDELRVVVAEATATRPALAALHRAATGSFLPATPDVPGPVQAGGPSVPGSHPGIPQVSGTAAGDYTATGVPTFDSVRDKVEERAGRALGAEELERGTKHGQSVEEQFAARAQAGQQRLAEIRKSLGLPAKSGEAGQ